MTQDDDHQELIKNIQNVFNLVAPNYDNPALRFFPHAAEQIAKHLPMQPQDKILDICTGTGVVAQALAPSLAQGQVIGIDISSGMLQQAKNKNEKLALHNIELHEMDALNLAFESNYFDSIVCSFGVFFMMDMVTALSHWKGFLKPGGLLCFTGFGELAFHPYIELTVKRMHEHYGVEFPENPLSWKRMATLEQIRQLLQGAGYEEVQILEKDMGYSMRDANDWWDILWNAGFRGHLSSLSHEQQGELKAYLHEALVEFAGDNGVPLNLPINLVLARKSA